MSTPTVLQLAPPKQPEAKSGATSALRSSDPGHPHSQQQFYCFAQARSRVLSPDCCKERRREVGGQLPCSHVHLTTESVLVRCPGRVQGQLSCVLQLVGGRASSPTLVILGPAILARGRWGVRFSLTHDRQREAGSALLLSHFRGGLPASPSTGQLKHAAKVRYMPMMRVEGPSFLSAGQFAHEGWSQLSWCSIQQGAGPATTGPLKRLKQHSIVPGTTCANTVHGHHHRLQLVGSLTQT